MSRHIVAFVAIIVITLLLSSSTSHALSLSYWYSDDDTIGHLTKKWIYIDNWGCGHSPQEALDFTIIARDQWRRASIQSHILDYFSPSIWIYNGSYSALKDFYPPLEGSAFETLVFSTADGTYSYNGRTIYNQKILGAILLMPKFPWHYFYTDNHYRCGYTHELGHAFGWYGHSNTSSDIMHGTLKQAYVLTSRDINHLMQIYSYD